LKHGDAREPVKVRGFWIKTCNLTLMLAVAMMRAELPLVGQCERRANGHLLSNLYFYILSEMAATPSWSRALPEFL
jgi:hypothetical protein